ncbi:hypothetical protein AB8B12_22025, partial [Streptomyces sp. PGLac3x]
PAASVSSPGWAPGAPAVLSGRTHHQVMFHDPDPAAVTLHVRLAEAVRERDADRAEALTREITIGALQELDILDPPPPPAPVGP